VNYASIKEEENGRSDLQRRIDDSVKMWEKLEEFSLCFKKYDRRLPTKEPIGAFTPIWINPVAASRWSTLEYHMKIKLTVDRYCHPGTPLLETSPP
jgi:hypothetical protein